MNSAKEKDPFSLLIESVGIVSYDESAILALENCSKGLVKDLLCDSLDFAEYAHHDMNDIDLNAAIKLKAHISHKFNTKIQYLSHFAESINSRPLESMMDSTPAIFKLKQYLDESRAVTQCYTSSDFVKKIAVDESLFESVKLNEDPISTSSQTQINDELWNEEHKKSDRSFSSLEVKKTPSKTTKPLNIFSEINDSEEGIESIDS